MKKLRKTIGFLCVLAMAFSTLIFQANACTEAYFPWNWNNGTYYPIKLTVQMCSSDFYNKTSSKTALYVWNDISSNMYIGSYYYAGETDENTKDINIHAAELPNGILGITHIYGKNAAGQYLEIHDITAAMPVVQARVELANSLLDKYSEYRTKTVIHEIGHCLGLRHPLDVDCVEVAVMQQTSSGLYSTTITEHDKNNLIAKWGK